MSDRTDAWGGFDVFKATRPVLDQPFADVTNGEELEGVNTAGNENSFTVSADGLTAVFMRGENCCTGGDLYITSRPNVEQPFGNIRHLEELEDGQSSEINPSLTPDGLTLFFAEWGITDTRPGGRGNGDIWVARREAADQRFSQPVDLPFPVNTGGYDWYPSIHGIWPYEGSTLYFVRCGPPCSGGESNQIYQSTWTPMRPFVRGDGNNDGSFDVTDAVFVLNSLFIGGPAPTCQKAADSNDDGDVDVADAVYFLNAKFLGGREVKEPHAECGTDPTPDTLTCETFSCP